MKSQHILPLVAAALGFSLAWVLKPAPEAPESGSVDSTASAGTANRVPRGELSRDRPSSPGSLPKEVDASEFPLVDLAEKGPKTRAEAKMLRLSEALELSIDQQADIIRIVDETKISADVDKPLLEDLTARGRKVEEALRDILTPAQYAKLEELRIRERDNRIENRALKALGQLMEEIDMSPGQREDALARLRQAEKERIQSIPESATLLLKNSVLPTGPREMTIDGVLTIAGLTDLPQAENPEAAEEQRRMNHRRLLEDKLRCYDGVLTPAQMGQLHAIIAEEKNMLDLVRQSIQPQRVQSAEPEDKLPARFDDEEEEDRGE
jgi:hypothetical protein